MKDVREYDALIVVTPADYLRVENLYERLLRLLPVRNLIFIGNSKVGELVKSSELGNRARFINEDDVIRFDDVHRAMKNAIGDYIHTELPRGITGWYYQQFLKLSYSGICADDYYMVWDGDTVPTKAFSMFGEGHGDTLGDGAIVPLFDMKSEYHKPYFDTIEKLFPGMHKSIGKSYISEHMLFKKSIVRDMLKDIMENPNLSGSTYYERIINRIEPADLMETSFSEFETFGTYVSFKAPEEYALRNWHSIRYGSVYFENNYLSEADFEWIGKDFDAVSFEKNQEFNPDIALIFKTPEYREKLTARQIIEAIQDSSSEGMKEVWDDDSDGDNKRQQEFTSEVVEPDTALADEYLFYNYLGDSLLVQNPNQAYLCYENAAFLCGDENIRKVIDNKKNELFQSGKVNVNRVSIVIVSYNSCYLMQQCLRSIKKYCAPSAYEVVVVDNASTDSVRDYLKCQKDIKLVLSDENLGFPKGCNVGIEYAGPKNDIYLLNNDTRMTHNALFWLRMGLYEDNSVGATGSVSNYCNVEQRVDVTFSMPDNYVEYGAKVNVFLKNPYEEKNRLCGFSMLIKREVLNRAGMLDEVFTPGYYEDEDLCLRIHSLGYKLLVCHNSFIYHAGSQSFIKRTDLEEIFDRNHQIMTEKCGYDTYKYSVILDEELELVNAITHKRDDYFSVLEIGAGSGNMLGRLKYMYPNASIYGIEDNSMVVEKAISAVPILCLNWKTDKLPFLNAFFDYIAVYERDSSDIDKDMMERIVSPMLKENGRLIYLGNN